jgi:hypothetical protein
MREVVRNAPAQLPPAVRRFDQALPKGFDFSALSALLGGDELIATAFSRLGVKPDAKEWFCRVDSMLRSEATAEELVRLTSVMAEIKGASSADAFWEAIVRDSRTASASRREQGRLRSLWGITPIIGLPVGVKADRTLGVEAESLVMTTYYSTNNFDIDLTNHVNLVRSTSLTLEQPFYWLVLMWAMLAYDIFFFYNDRGILTPEEFTGRLYMGIRHEELALLRRADKYLYTMPYGADFRTHQRATEVSRFNFCMDCPEVGKFCFCNDEAWPLVFHTIGAYATAMLGWGLALREIPGSRRSDFVVVDTDLIKPSYAEWTPGRNLRVLHVPNHSHFKGTKYLEEAVERLSAHAPIELTMASGIANAEVLQLMRDCDLVVDQLIGGHFGLTALEAMASGKPVVVYLVDRNTAIAPEECPLIDANPDTIFDVLSRLAADPAALVEIGRRSRRYVEKHYSIPALAQRLRDLYKETADIDLARPSERPNAPVEGVAV